MTLDVCQSAIKALNPTTWMKCAAAEAPGKDVFASDEFFPWSEASTESPSEIGSWRSGDSSLASIEEEILPCVPDEPVVIFDWDDTLIPTSFFDFQGTMATPAGQSVAMAAATARHVQHVESVLRTARSVGRVAIVTMANERWFKKSARRFLPGLEIEALMQELDIPVYYAREYGSHDSLRQASSFDTAVAHKQAAMMRCFEDFGVVEASVSKPVNVVSIGDSLIEHRALQECIGAVSKSGDLNFAPLCKTVKLMDSPTVTQLSSELRQLEQSLYGIVMDESSFHIAAASAAELESKVVARFEQYGDRSIVSL